MSAMEVASAPRPSAASSGGIGSGIENKEADKVSVGGTLLHSTPAARSRIPSVILLFVTAVVGLCFRY
jgi:hypothetical protein